MTDEAGAAPAAAEPIVPSQGIAGAEAQPDTGARQAGPVIERSKETARASIDRAFAALDKEDAGEKGKAKDTGKAADATTVEEREDGRDEKGRFKAKDTAASVEGQKLPEAAADKTKTPVADKVPGGHAEPPARFSADAKAAWATAPEAVRAETHRALKELSDGLSQYQQVFEPLKPFYQLAQKFDTTVHETLERYVGLDFALVSNRPEERLGAIEKVLDYAGISPKEYAAFIMGQKPDEEQSQNDRTIRELRQELAELKNQMGGVSKSLQQRREDETLKQVEAFAEENPRLKELEFQKLVFRLLSTHMADDLKSAFDMASRLNPAPADSTQTTAASTAATTRPNAAQTRNGNLSITGGPGSGSNPAKRKAPSTARESVDNAFASLGLG
jgi:hypothetical protein